MKYRINNFVCCFYCTMTKVPSTYPCNVAVTSSALLAQVLTMISTFPNPNKIPPSLDFSVFIKPGSIVVPQLVQPLHS